MSRVADPLNIRYAFSLDDKSISPAQVMRLGKIAKTLGTIVRPGAALRNCGQSVLSYARAPEEYYAMRFVDFCIADIVEVMLFSYLLLTNSGGTYAQEITASNMIIKYKDMLLLVVNVSEGAVMENNFGVTHYDDRSRYISLEDDTLLMIQTTNSFLRSVHKPIIFLTSVLRRHAMELTHEPPARQPKQVEE